jgi:hypothetical protein
MKKLMLMLAILGIFNTQGFAQETQEPNKEPEVNTDVTVRDSDLQDYKKIAGKVVVRTGSTHVLDTGFRLFSNRIAFDVRSRAGRDGFIILRADGVEVQKVSISSRFWTTKVVSFTRPFRTLEITPMLDDSEIGAVVLKNIRALSHVYRPGPGGQTGPIFTGGGVVTIESAVFYLANNLVYVRDYVSGTAFDAHFRPIQDKAEDIIILLQTNASLSEIMKEVTLLKLQLEKAMPIIQELRKTEVTRDLANNLIQIKLFIDQAIR